MSQVTSISSAALNSTDRIVQASDTDASILWILNPGEDVFLVLKRAHIDNTLKSPLLLDASNRFVAKLVGGKDALGMGELLSLAVSVAVLVAFSNKIVAHEIQESVSDVRCIQINPVERLSQGVPEVFLIIVTHGQNLERICIVEDELGMIQNVHVARFLLEIAPRYVCDVEEAKKHLSEDAEKGTV